MTAPTPEDPMAAVAATLLSKVALRGYTFVGVVDPHDSDRCWTYSVGMPSHGFPDVVLVGLHPHQAEPILDALVTAMLEGDVDPHNPCVYDGDVDLDYSVPFRLRGPVRTDTESWPLTFSRTVPPKDDAASGWAVQLVWPDELGIFPTENADTITVAGVAVRQPLLPIGPARD